MYTSERVVASTETRETWIAWPVCWSAVWVGALASIAAALVLGLVGIALGATSLERVKDFSAWKSVSLFDVAVAILSSFLAFVIGGWVTGKIAGIRRAEPAILHGAISWLVALPLLVVSLALGAGKAFGGWYGGIIGAPFATQSVTVVLAPEVIRHYAAASVTAILLGLVGAVIGGWMASGEPMSLTHHRTRESNVQRVKGGSAS